jgi:hypothetical protein
MTISKTKKDTAAIVKKLENVILEHRSYFSDWRSSRWDEFDKSVSDRDKASNKKHHGDDEKTAAR